MHRHSGIGWHTPASVHFDTADAIDDARQATLTTAYHANPGTVRPTTPPTPTTGKGLDQPATTSTSIQSTARSWSPSGAEVWSPA